MYPLYPTIYVDTWFSCLNYYVSLTIWINNYYMRFCCVYRWKNFINFPENSNEKLVETRSSLGSVGGAMEWTFFQNFQYVSLHKREKSPPDRPPPTFSSSAAVKRISSKNIVSFFGAHLKKENVCTKSLSNKYRKMGESNVDALLWICGAKIFNGFL